MKGRRQLKNHKLAKLLLSFLFVLESFLIIGCSDKKAEPTFASVQTLQDIPEYTNSTYVEIHNNIPQFDEKDMTTTSFEHYSELDHLKRAGVAYANIGTDLMPKQKRGSIGQIKPSGWKTVKYDIVDGKYLYNRSHLIGFQLSGENANEKNLITGTRYFNATGMLPFENMVADYVKETKNHVLYRVTPIYDGDNLVASGVQMEAYSVEDDGEGISFNVYVYNVQPGITINYANGDSSLAEDGVTKHNESLEIRGNKKSKVYHMPDQNSYKDMESSKNLIIFHSEQEAKDAGYRKAKQ